MRNFKLKFCAFLLVASVTTMSSQNEDNPWLFSVGVSAIDINPSYDKAYGAMGDIYIQQKDYEKAKQTLKMATTVNPNYSKGYANLGVIFSEEEDWNQAISSLEMAVALNARDSMSYFRLSGAHNMNGDCGSALDAARKSTELKNRFGGAWFELGTAEWCNGSGNKAGAAAQHAVPARWQAVRGHGFQIYPDHKVTSHSQAWHQR